MPIFIVTDLFDEPDNGRPTGRKNLEASHGIDLDSMKNVTVSNEHPRAIGAVRDPGTGAYLVWKEWETTRTLSNGQKCLLEEFVEEYPVPEAPENRPRRLTKPPSACF